MFSLKELPLKSKLIAMQLITACIVLLFYAAFSFFNDMRAARGAMVSQLTTTADLIAGNSFSALDFMDASAADKVLASLEAEPDIVNACIFDKEGQVFAKYSQREHIDYQPARPEKELAEFSGGYLTVSRRIVRGNEVLGAVLLRSDMKRYRSVLTSSALLALAALLAGLLAALLLSMRMQRAISGPVLGLYAAARRITETGNYSIKVEKQGADEIGRLGDAFNALISQVQEREASLQAAHKELEDRVKERTEELRAAGEQLGAIFESASSGIVLATDRVIVRSNRKLDEIFGYAPGEMIGKKTRVWYPDEKTFEEIGAGISSCVARGEIYLGEHYLVRKDGSRFWGRMKVRATDKSYPAQGVVGVIDDITVERENAEALKTAKESAESADRLKSAFLATMSHELRTPLNSIIGFAGILQQELPGPLNEEQKKQLGMVSGSAEHLLDLINDVLDISKIEAGQLHVASEPFDLREAVHKAVLTARPLAEKKGIGLEEKIAPEVGTITADRRRVEQIMLNLLSNSIKFTEKGGVRAECALKEGRVFIQVVDSGIGMRKEDLEKLFKPFQQIDTGLSRQYEGTGLGLSICKRLTELMGGTIGVESEPGKGSTFSVTLPVERKTI